MPTASSSTIGTVATAVVNCCMSTVAQVRVGRPILAPRGSESPRFVLPQRGSTMGSSRRKRGAPGGSNPALDAMLKAQDSVAQFAANPALDAMLKAQDSVAQFAANPALDAMLKANSDRYGLLIDQASESAGRARTIAAASPMSVPRSSTESMPPNLDSEIPRVAGLVESMAEGIGVLAVIGRDQQASMMRMELETAATRRETVLLREALVRGQHSADRLGQVNLAVAIVLAVLTAVVAWLTWVLATRP